MPKTTSFSEQPANQVAIGPVMQSVVPAAVMNAPATVAATSTWTSNLILTDGWEKISAAIKANQNGNFSIQRYLDDAGTITQGAATTTAVTANTQANIDITDGKPFSSFTVSFQNTAGSQATIAALIVLLQAQ